MSITIHEYMNTVEETYTDLYNISLDLKRISDYYKFNDIVSSTLFRTFHDKVKPLARALNTATNHLDLEDKQDNE